MVNSGIMDISFYNEYIKHHLRKDILKIFQDAFELMEYIEYYVVAIPSHSISHYHEVFFFDIFTMKQGIYYPVFINMINGSSGYAMVRSGMDRDLDMDEEELNWSVDDMVDRVPDDWKYAILNRFN